MQELYTAMSKAFPLIEGALKDSNNPHFKSKYADLASVVMAIKPALAENGLWFRQVNHIMDGGVCIETFICHASGQEVTCGQLYVPASKQDAQGYGSALTYARRYSLSAAFGVCPEDDDGNAASAAPKAPPAPPAPPISIQQVLELQALIETTGTDIAGMCRFYKIAALKDMPSDKFDHAKNALAKKVIDNSNS